MKTGNTALGTFTRTTTVSGSYTRMDCGPGETLGSGTGTYSGSLSETADVTGAVFNQTLSGTDRYSLLEQFTDVSNTSAGNTPGNMNFVAFGQPFVDPFGGGAGGGQPPRPGETPLNRMQQNPMTAQGNTGWVLARVTRTTWYWIYVGPFVAPGDTGSQRQTAVGGGGGLVPSAPGKDPTGNQVILLSPGYLGGYGPRWTYLERAPGMMPHPPVPPPSPQPPACPGGRLGPPVVPGTPP